MDFNKSTILRYAITIRLYVNHFDKMYSGM
jgi:hypothetical protein